MLDFGTRFALGISFAVKTMSLMIGRGPSVLAVVFARGKYPQQVACINLHCSYFEGGAIAMMQAFLSFL